MEQVIDSPLERFFFVQYNAPAAGRKGIFGDSRRETLHNYEDIQCENYKLCLVCQTFPANAFMECDNSLEQEERNDRLFAILAHIEGIK